MDKLQKLDSSKPETVAEFHELSPLLRVAVYATISDINDQLTINASAKVQINPRFQAHRELFPKNFDDDFEQRRHALTYLQRVGAVEQFDVPGLSILPPEPWEKASVQVNATRFKEIKGKVTEAFNHQSKPAATAAPTTRRGQEKPAAEPRREQSVDVVYEVKYTPAREILINGLLLAKLDFARENDNVFDYLYKNPDRTISISELEKHLGESMRKSPSKIVENLGFAGEFKKVFFDISKDSIRFRKQITRSQLQEFGITWLRIPRQ